MKMIALNYLCVSPKLAGGKDQVGLNLLKGFYKNNDTSAIIVICYDYSVDIITETAPGIIVIPVKSVHNYNELMRLVSLYFVNTFLLPQIIKKYKIDLVFHLSIYNGFRKLNAISVVIPHDIKQIAHRKIGSLKVPAYKYYLYRMVYYISFLNADKIIAISDCDKDDITTFYSQFANKVKRIYNPINFDNDFAIQPNNPIPYKYILAVNLQFIHKNIITLIKAFESISDQIGYKLVLVGSIPTRVQYIKDYVIDNKLQDNVIFTGFVSDEEMHQWISHASLYVNPTLFEGFGMTAIEAMIQLVPTLVSKIPANVEVTKGLCNYYDEPENYKELAARIIQCLKMKYGIEHYRKIREQLIREYDYKEISRQYMDYFCELLTKG